MRVVQATFGVFHSFELAHQLQQRGYLERIYTTWPWARVKREGLPHELVRTFPLLHTTDYLLGRTSYYPRWLAKPIKHHVGTTFDRWVAARMPACDVLIGLSGMGLLAGPRIQARGGKFICDRGSTHHRFQTETLQAEYQRWGLVFERANEREIARDEAIYEVADMITVPSTVAARSFVAQGMPPSKLRVIPYGVRLDNFSKSAKSPDNAFEVLFVGQVSLRKGIPYLLQAFSRLNHPHKRLTIVGPVLQETEALLKRLPSGHVTFTGPVAQAEVARLMSVSHVLVLPSVEEGLALVQAQALACELPIIATEATGAEDLFSDGVEGYIVKDRDVDALHERLERLAGDPALREQMAAAALARVRSIGGWNVYGERWEALLHELTGL